MNLMFNTERKDDKMTIILFDGTTISCRQIEIGFDGASLIVDGYRMVEMNTILKIVSTERSKLGAL